MTEPDGRVVTPWAGSVETHTGAVFFLGDIAVKVRKAVQFSFVDLSTPARRRRASEEEVRLNRRLSPDVYLGVGELVLPAGTPEPVVVMRRLPAHRRLSALVRDRGEGLDDVIEIIAATLASFHASCEVRHDLGDVGQLRALWDDFAATLAQHPELVQVDRLTRLHGQAIAYLEGRRQLFVQRLTEGYVRDGHGDLLADDIFVLDDGPRVLDCLDFDERLRCGDVLLDVAFLAMDLERLGAAALARRLLDRYEHHAGGTHPASLAHFYIAYRAAVRAKVMALRSAQGDATAAADIGRLMGLAARHLREATAVVVVVGGLPGSGKSTLAGALASHPGWTRVSTDDLRRQRSAGSDRYSVEARTAVYDDVLVRADDLIGLGGSVVLDATWGQEAWRERARDLAARRHAVLVELQCVVDDAVAVRRLAGRVRDVSEADAEVRRLLAPSFAPWPQAQVIDTADGGAAAEAAEAAVAAATGR